MHLRRTRTETPLPDAYTRVTNPERFLPLRALAVDMMSRLGREYHVTETSAFELIADIMRPFEYARPPMTLTPSSSKEAPISIAFTTFPGLIVRCGRFFHDSFPFCGCDGCAATFDREAERLLQVVGFVVAGEFREEIDIPLIGPPHVRWSLGAIDSPNGSLSSECALTRDGALTLSTESRRIEWSPWSKRMGEPGIGPAIYGSSLRSHSI